MLTAKEAKNLCEQAKLEEAQARLLAEVAEAELQAERAREYEATLLPSVLEQLDKRIRECARSGRSTLSLSFIEITNMTNLAEGTPELDLFASLLQKAFQQAGYRMELRDSLMDSAKWISISWP